MQNHYESFRALPESFNGRAGVEPRAPSKPPDCPTPTPSYVGSMCLHHSHNNKPCRHLVPKASLLLLSFFSFFSFLNQTSQESPAVTLYLPLS